LSTRWLFLADSHPVRKGRAGEWRVVFQFPYLLVQQSGDALFGEMKRQSARLAGLADRNAGHDPGELIDFYPGATARRFKSRRQSVKCCFIRVRDWDELRAVIY
jgi:hypothetical protein